MARDAARSKTRPNVVLVVADDMGYSDIGCYGGEIATPNLDQLARRGIRMSQFYNTARCSPSRASLLTGLHPHQAGIGILTNDDRPDGYAGTLNDRCVTIAEVLGANGYATSICGKWHLTNARFEPNDAWPTRRGFQRFFGTLDGSSNYWNPTTLTRDETSLEESDLPADFYYTNAISDTAADFISSHDGGRPFFLYVAYNAPHWPLHALPEDIEAYRGRYDAGWDDLRQARLDRLVDEGLLDPSWRLTDRDPDVPAWTDTPDRDWQARRMEVYAAQVTAMDRGVGRIVDALERTGALDDTLFVFLSDNGGCAEDQPLGYVDESEPKPPSVLPRTRDGKRVFRGNTPSVIPGAEDTYASYGRCWANLSNTPFREYKHWVHEGGIATPMVVHWPAGLAHAGVVRHEAHQLTDVMATVLEVTGTSYPDRYPGRDLLPPEGRSMLATWRGEPSDERFLYWEHEGNAAVRCGRWKLVCRYRRAWELYDMVADRTETTDVADQHPAVVAELTEAYELWASRCGVIPRDKVIEDYRNRGRNIWPPPEH